MDPARAHMDSQNNTNHAPHKSTPPNPKHNLWTQHEHTRKMEQSNQAKGTRSPIAVLKHSTPQRPTRDPTLGLCTGTCQLWRSELQGYKISTARRSPRQGRFPIWRRLLLTQPGRWETVALAGAEERSKGLGVARRLALTSWTPRDGHDRRLPRRWGGRRRGARG